MIPALPRWAWGAIGAALVVLTAAGETVLLDIS